VQPWQERGEEAIDHGLPRKSKCWLSIFMGCTPGSPLPFGIGE
jgi:hypothetical protein